MNLDYPFHPDARKRTALAGDADHIRQMVEQVLFTNPGERVNRPAFGSGLLQLAFTPLNDALLAATHMTVQASLQQWLGDVIQVEGVEVTGQDATLRVVVQYSIRSSGARQIATFERSGQR